jgi:hypothetical protein
LAKGLIAELMPRYSNGAYMSQKDEQHRDKVSKWYDAVLRIIQARCSASWTKLTLNIMSSSCVVSTADREVQPFEQQTPKQQ